VFGVVIALSIGRYVAGYFLRTEVQQAKWARYPNFSHPRMVRIYNPMLSIESWIVGVQAKASILKMQVSVWLARG
jgi:hypothetical protein